MAAVICGIFGDYGGRAETYEVFLWRKEAGFCCIGNYNDDFGNADDTTDYVVLLWDGVFDFSGGKFIDFADVTLCDGISFFDGDFCGGAGSGIGYFLVRNETARFSYFGGGVFWRNEVVYG